MIEGVKHEHKIQLNIKSKFSFSYVTPSLMMILRNIKMFLKSFFSFFFEETGGKKEV